MWHQELPGYLAKKNNNFSKKTDSFSIVIPNVFKLGTYATFCNSNIFGEFRDVTIPISPIIPISKDIVRWSTRRMFDNPS